MNAGLQAGLSHVNRIKVDRDRTIDFMGEEARVYGTPFLVRDIEQTCRQLLLQYAEPGEDSVGMEISVRHLAPTLLGMDVIMALPNVIIGALAAGIAYGRWQLAPLKRR